MENGFFTPRIYCENGVSLSVQASSGHHCTPKVDGLQWHEHKTVEVGFIKRADGERYQAPKSWLKYAEDRTLFSDVFANVPVNAVRRFIDANGGDVLGGAI